MVTLYVSVCVSGASEYIHKCERAIAAALCSVYNSYNPPVAVLGGPLAPLYFDGVVAQLNNNPTVGRNLKVSPLHSTPVQSPTLRRDPNQQLLEKGAFFSVGKSYQRQFFLRVGLFS